MQPAVYPGSNVTYELCMLRQRTTDVGGDQRTTSGHVLVTLQVFSGRASDRCLVKM